MHACHHLLLICLSELTWKQTFISNTGPGGRIMAHYNVSIDYKSRAASWMNSAFELHSSVTELNFSKESNRYCNTDYVFSAFTCTCKSPRGVLTSLSCKWKRGRHWTVATDNLKSVKVVKAGLAFLLEDLALTDWMGLQVYILLIHSSAISQPLNETSRFNLPIRSPCGNREMLKHRAFHLVFHYFTSWQSLR